MTKSPTKKPGDTKTDGRTVSDAENTLWQQVTDDVEPLAGTGESITLPLDTGTLLAPRKSSAGPPVVGAPSAPPELVHGSAPGLDRSTQQKMRRGKIIIEARIDLHGMTQNEAHNALSDFLYVCRAAGLRGVLVITGKGAGGEGILRAGVPNWLNEGENRRMVRAFSHAAPKDGGEGALYVLLKRLK